MRLEHFNDAAVRDPKVRAFMARIDAEPHPDAVMETNDISSPMCASRRMTARCSKPMSTARSAGTGSTRLPPWPWNRSFAIAPASCSTAMRCSPLRSGHPRHRDQKDLSSIGSLMRAGPRAALICGLRS